jgi:hypothetical protein
LHLSERIRKALVVPFTLLRSGEAKRAEVARLLAEFPGHSLAQIAALGGVSRATVDRVKRKLRKAAEAQQRRRWRPRGAV